MTITRRTTLGVIGGAALAGATGARAQSYPDKPIKIVVPYTPGGFNDTLGRIIAQHLQETWGQPAVVENRPGGGTLIGSDSVAKAPPDGATLLIVAFPFGANPGIYPKLPYDTVKDFTPLMLAGQTSNLLVVNPSLPVSSVKELLDMVKKEPGKLSYGSTGIGSSNHLSMELFKSMAGVNIVHVPYKGSAPMVSDLLGNHVQLAFDNTPNVLPQVKAGKLRAIGVSSMKASQFAPEVPTVDSAGVPGYEVGVWFGIVGPANLPAPIRDKLSAELNRMLTLPAIKQRFAEQGVDPIGGTPQAFSDHIKSQIEKWTKVAKDANIKAE
ncbi:tripartite tricarboxylate transporter family receptor [Variibacter gotjawalensis]|uniref:Tripartite tricarboxylate transporter family receptor n=1 Tax=Variibacter gotjawalensis TaxID=1333996 RepID=A0A0S3PWF1_9BRAD|nr:tripartite tricarboxylate transporter substrate binding protein [Variibacter gotjawalensis]NIK46048.1 tripartite-type tricarboxylate transporter receptor subunit TctC [Variibacter gotjawalensis]RZS47966.1 tripartite-type tricarboxylate transporter receptor subunit TctC [Variibacter gotjawalensis]BAT60222.1 tripartite tricarboxylate transporter family receptor [Variibacter gotjawalensis]